MSLPIEAENLREGASMYRQRKVGKGGKEITGRGMALTCCHCCSCGDTFIRSNHLNHALKGGLRDTFVMRTQVRGISSTSSYNAHICHHHNAVVNPTSTSQRRGSLHTVQPCVIHFTNLTNIPMLRWWTTSRNCHDVRWSFSASNVDYNL